MKEIILKVDGMMCEGCQSRIQNILKEIDGVTDVIADYKSKKVTIKANENVSISIIENSIEDLGYSIIK